MSDMSTLMDYNSRKNSYDTLANLGDLQGFTDDLGGMANAIEEMGNSITELTTFAKQQAETLLAELPSEDIIKPLALGIGVLLGGFLLTGIASNIKNLTK